MALLEKIFKLSYYKTNPKTESIAGLSTFLTMVYIIFVNPAILSQAQMDPGAIFVATCLVTALGCFLSGLLSNYPLAVAPAMALNAYFAFVVVQGMGYSWQSALGAVFISGVLFFIIAITPMRRWLIDAIPDTMHMAIAAGLGLFIALLGLKGGGLVVPNPHTLLSLGNVHSASVILFFVGFCIITALDYLRIQGAIVIGILVVTAISIFVNHVHFYGVFSMPPSLSPTLFHFSFEGLWSSNGFT